MSDFSVRGRLLLGDRLLEGAVVVREGRIAVIVRGQPAEPMPQPVIEAAIVAPGFIDLQVNGGFGVDVAEGAGALRVLAARLPCAGVTAYLPTVITSPAAVYPRLFAAFEDARRAPGAQALGLHLEGPFLSPARHGAHRRDLIEAADPRLFDLFIESGATRLVTLAAERAGALPWITRLNERGVVVSLGHTDAAYEEFARGVDAGARMATHLYNAMATFAHRAPCAIGAALVDDRVTVGLIADGVHSHPGAVDLALRAKGVERVALVSDMMAAAGMPPGAYPLGDRMVVVDGGTARLADGTLAGAVLMLDQAVRNVVEWANVSPAEALRMASEVPARLLSLDRKGRIVAGADADLALLDDSLRVEGTIVAGDIVYRAA